MLSRAEEQYKVLITKIVGNGSMKCPTKGATRSLFGYTIQLGPEEVPLLLGRKIHYKGIIGELKAFLANASTQEEFQKFGCNFWGAWSNEDGTLDVDYARLLHNFNGVNQLERVMNSLIDEPDSRKHIISLWDPSSNAKQVPCVMHYQWEVVDGTLNMIWSQRSVDVMIGLASDMFSAWLFNQVIAISLGYTPGVVTMQLGDCHIYESHLSKVVDYMSGTKTRGLRPAKFDTDIESEYDWDIEIIDYNPAKTIKFDLCT